VLLKLTASIIVSDLCVNSDDIFCSDLKGELIENMKKTLVVGAKKCHIIQLKLTVNFL